MTRKKKSLTRYILLTALVAGTLDGTAAIIQYLVNGHSDSRRIFRYIASAALGPRAYSGGTEMVWLGVIFHYTFAFLFTAIYYLIYPPLQWLQKNVAISALIYGLFTWAVMNLVVVKLSRLNPVPFHPGKAAVAATILIFCIGLPVSLLARKYYLYKK